MDGSTEKTFFVLIISENLSYNLSGHYRLISCDYFIVCLLLTYFSLNVEKQYYYYYYIILKQKTLTGLPSELS